MNNEEDLNIGHPDPVWGYYILWHSLHHIKAKIDAALKIMAEHEYASVEGDEEIKNILVPASNKLVEIIDQLPMEDED